MLSMLSMLSMLFMLSIYLSRYLSICLSVYLSIYLSIYLCYLCNLFCGMEYFFSTKCFSYNHYHHYAAFFPNCDLHSGSWVLPNLTFNLTFTTRDNRHYPKHSMPGPCLFLFYAAKEVAPLHMVIYIFPPITIHAAKLGHQKLQWVTILFKTWCCWECGCGFEFHDHVDVLHTNRARFREGCGIFGCLVFGP